MVSTTRRALVGSIWVTLLLALCAWIVMTAGLSSIQQSCPGQSASFFTGRLFAVPGLPGVGSCKHLYQFWWWVWALEISILVTLSLALLMGHLHSSRVMFTGLLATLSVLTWFGSNTFFFHRYGNTGSYRSRIDVTFAGFLMAAAFNTLLLIVVAIDPMPKIHDEHVTKTRTQTTATPVATPVIPRATEGQGHVV